jgi:hypothetical protein
MGPVPLNDLSVFPSDPIFFDLHFMVLEIDLFGGSFGFYMLVHQTTDVPAIVKQPIIQ